MLDLQEYFNVSVEIMHSRLKFLIAITLVVCFLTGCNSTSAKETYENPELGISLERPGTWDLEYYERNGSIVLKAKNVIRDKGSTLVVIFGNACSPKPSWFDSPDEEVIKLDIDRIRRLYNLDTITVVQEPTIFENGNIEVIKAIIAIPTMSLPEDSSANQMGDQDPNLFQLIEIYGITENNDFTMAYIYKGSSEKLNNEAEEIVNSIQFICPTPN